MFDRFVDFVVHRPWHALVLTALVSVLLGAALPGLYVVGDPRAYIPDGDDAGANLYQLEDLFGSIESVSVLVMREDHPDGIYNPGSLALVDRITEWLRAREDLETSMPSDLRSPTTVNDVRGNDEGMVVEPFVAELPRTGEEALAVRRAFERNPLFLGHVVAFDGKGALVTTKESAAGKADRIGIYDDLMAYLDSLSAEGHPETFHLTGAALVQGIIEHYIPLEGQRLAPWLAGMIALALAASFRTLRGVLIPFLVVVLTEVWMFGFLALWGRPVYSLTAILPILIVSIAIADSIHLLARYYDAQYEQPDADRATIVRATMHSMGVPVFMTSLTTAVGFLAMLTSELPPMRDFGVITAVGIAAALALTLVLIPALLALLPLQKPRLSRRTRHVEASSTMARALAGSAAMANRRPLLVCAVFAAVAAASVAGIAAVRVDAANESNFRPSHPVRVATRVLNDHFVGGTVLDVIVDGGAPDAMKNPALLSGMLRLQKTMESLDGVGGTLSIAELLARMHRVMNEDRQDFERIPDSRELVAQYLLLYSISGDPGDFDDLVDYDYRYGHIYIYMRRPGTEISRAAVALAEHAIPEIFGTSAWEGDSLLSYTLDEAAVDIAAPHDDAPPAHFDTPVRVKLAGWAYSATHFEHYLLWGQVRTLVICLPVLAGLTAWMLGSGLLGLLCVLPVAFAIAIIFGVMGVTGIAVDMSTIILAGLTLGVGIDFAIHWLHRYRELRREGTRHAEACRITALTTGRALFFNALVLVAGFSVMLGSRFYPHAKIGALVSATMAICYVVTMYLFPAILRVGGARRPPAR